MSSIPLTVVTVVTVAPRCDCRRCDLYIHNPNAAEPICSGSSGCSYCSCAATEYGARMNTCDQCPIRCGSRAGSNPMSSWVRDVGGTFSFDDIPAPAPLPDGLPRVIPVVDGMATDLDARAAWPAYGIGLRRVYSPLTWDVKPLWRDATAHEALRIPAERKIVLVGYGTDPLVEAFWTRRYSLYPFLAAKRFDLVLAPNYSMYGSQPRAEHLLNFRRSMLVAAEMVKEGIPAVPNIYWFRKEDLDRYLAWAADVEPQALALNLQTQRTTEDWEVMVLPGLSYLAATLDPSIRLLVNGTIRPDRLTNLVELFGAERLTLFTQSPIQEARHGKVIGVDGKVTVVKARPEDAFAMSVGNVATLVGELHRQVQERREVEVTDG